MSALAAERAVYCEGCGQPLNEHVRSTKRHHNATCRSRAFRRLRRGNGEPVETAAMLLRAEWVLPLVQAGELDGEEALVLVLEPGPELRGRSERTARRVAA